MAAPQNFSSIDKPFGISQTRAYIPIVLDLDKMNYDVWTEIFETHCLTFGVLDHLNGTAVATPDTEKEWKEHNSLVKMWIYGTITDSLVETILTPKSSALDLWLALENMFRDNKENRAIQLENELRTITIGDLSVQEYCRKLKSLFDLLANVGSPVTDRQLVMHCLNGLNDKFDDIHNVIRHRSPFPTFHTTRSMLLAEEERLNKNNHPAVTHTDNTSSSTVLFAGNNNTNNVSDSSNCQSNHNNYNRGAHNNRNRNNNRGGGRGNRGCGRNNNSMQPFYEYPPWNFSQPHWPFPYYPGASMPSFPLPQHAPYNNKQNGILGPYTQQQHSEALIAHGTTTLPSTQTLIPQDLAQAFNT